MFNEQFKKLPKKTKHLRSLRHFLHIILGHGTACHQMTPLLSLSPFHFHLFTFTFSRLGKITNWLGTAQSLEEWTPLWSTPGICGFQIFCSITGALRKWLIDTWCSSHIHIRIETNKGNNVCWPYSQSKWWLKNYYLLLCKTWLLNLITSFVFHLRFWFV